MTENNDQEVQKSSPVGEIAKRILSHDNGVLAIIMVAIIAIMAIITKGRTLTEGNARNILVQSTSRGIASIGQLFVILSAGIDVSIGGLALMCAILGASLISHQPTVPIGAIALVFLAGLGVGAFNGILVARVGMPPLIVTLAMWQVTKGAGYMICRGMVIRNIPEGFNFIGGGYIGGVPTPVIIFIALAIVAYFVLNHTTFGRLVYAVGGNPASAWLSGIKTSQMTVAMYCISGFLAALAGLVIMSRVMSAGMTTVVGLELNSIAAVCIGGVSLAGGRGTLVGAMIGVFILGIINNGMNVFGIDPAYQDVVIGGIILAAVGADYIRRRR